MNPYFHTLRGYTDLSTRSGASANVHPTFRILSSLVVSESSFMQEQIQRVIFSSHGSELLRAKHTLQGVPNPKARLELLCNFPYKINDSTIEKVFEYARQEFQKIYELRNILAHEVWLSSDAFPSAVLFTTLENNAKLLMASGKILHSESPTAQETYNSTISFINNVKAVNQQQLELALHKISVCSWALMNIAALLTEPDLEKREEARRAFRVFSGTSHLFTDAPKETTSVNYSSRQSKETSQ